MTTTVDTTPADEYAKRALFAVLDAATARHKAAAKRAKKKYRPEALVAETVAVAAPYAKEWRLVLSAVAQQFSVFAVGTPRGVGGKYRNGYDVTLFGFASDVALALDVWQQIRAVADEGMKTSTPFTGEDTGTHRSSWLLGFQLGLVGFDPGDVDEQAAVEERIAAPITQDPLDVRMRSTGTGAWAGYQTARRIRLVPTAQPLPIADGEPADVAA